MYLILRQKGIRIQNLLARIAEFLRCIPSDMYYNRGISLGSILIFIENITVQITDRSII